jgi:hypothetical protein
MFGREPFRQDVPRDDGLCRREIALTRGSRLIFGRDASGRCNLPPDVIDIGQASPEHFEMIFTCRAAGIVSKPTVMGGQYLPSM